MNDKISKAKFFKTKIKVKRALHSKDEEKPSILD